MKKARVLVLMHEDNVPPDSVEGLSDKEILPWKAEYDVVSTLRQIGYEVQPLGVSTDLTEIRRTIAEWKPHVAFNLLEEFHGLAAFDQHVTSYLELLKQPYTGCNPRGLTLTHDKALSKKILSYHRIHVPRFRVFPLGKTFRMTRGLRYPLLVKSLIQEGSYGIAQASVVANEEKLRERVAYLHEELETHAIAEEYIEGRELYIAMLGNRRPQTFPVLELRLGNLPEGVPRIATSKVKWDWEYQKKYEIDVEVVKDLDVAQVRRIEHLARRIWRILGMSGYGRIDLRLREDGKVFVLEANPNADIAYGEEMCTSAEVIGKSYEWLLERVIKLGRTYKPEWRMLE